MSAQSKICSIIFVLCLPATEALAQNVNLARDFLEIFEAQPASARASAMGYAQVANGGTIAEARINPATLGQMPQKLQTEFGYSWPSFVEKKAHTSFVGVAYRVNSKLTLGISGFSYGVKNPFFGYSKDQNTFISPSKVTESFYTGTASCEIRKGLRAGVNLNYFNYHIEGLPNSGSFFADVGAAYERKIGKKSNSVFDNLVRLAASFTNVNMAKTQWKFANGPVDVVITSHAFGGASLNTGVDLRQYLYGKSKLVDERSRVIDVMLQLQYVNFVHMKLTEEGTVSHKNQNKVWGFGAGAEFTLLKLLALRFGYLYEKRQGDDKPFGSSKYGNFPYKKGFTFGAGIHLPVNRLSNGKLPFDIAIDYVHRNQPFKWLKQNNYIKEKPTTNINLRINWYLKK